MRSKFACLKGNHHGVLTETKVGFPVIDPTKGDPGAGADPGFDLNSFLSKDPSFLPLNQSSLSSMCGPGIW